MDLSKLKTWCWDAGILSLLDNCHVLRYHCIISFGHVLFLQWNVVSLCCRFMNIYSPNFVITFNQPSFKIDINQMLSANRILQLTRFRRLSENAVAQSTNQVIRTPDAPSNACAEKKENEVVTIVQKNQF